MTLHRISIVQTTNEIINFCVFSAFLFLLFFADMISPYEDFEKRIQKERAKLMEVLNPKV